MIEILQGETLSFVLDGDDLSQYEVRAALRPSGTSFRRDCSCGESVLSWDDINVNGGVAAWTLTTEQSATLPIGKYAMEVALRDVASQQDIKDSTIDIINVKPSYTR
ncbi:MAG: hypothetical protein IKA07_08830 [Alistipes sp.]|nr:hypothetical protein [Alistipes sp.]